MKLNPRLKNVLFIVAAVVLAYASQYLADEPTTQTTVGAGTGGDTVLAAYRARRSEVMVEASGSVEKILRDDNEGSRHQRFILTLSGGHTVLVAHNIDLAPRVPMRQGDSVTLRGQYEWNDRGGVIHWTHHDPQGNHPGGWIRHGGEVYE